MIVNIAHVRDQGIDFVVFDADATAKNSQARERVLAQLTAAARNAGLKVDKSALAFSENGQLKFYGTPDLVRYLVSRGGVPHWTHTITVP